MGFGRAFLCPNANGAGFDHSIFAMRMWAQFRAPRRVRMKRAMADKAPLTWIDPNDLGAHGHWAQTIFRTVSPPEPGGMSIQPLSSLLSNEIVVPPAIGSECVLDERNLKRSSIRCRIIWRMAGSAMLAASAGLRMICIKAFRSWTGIGDADVAVSLSAWRGVEIDSYGHVSSLVNRRKKCPRPVREVGIGLDEIETG